MSSFADQLGHVLLYVVVGVLAAATVNVYVPGGVLTRVFYDSELLGVATGAVASTPFYVCGGGVLPLLGELLDKGLPPGIVLAFIVAGPATRLQALAAVAVLLRKRAVAAYVLYIWLCAFAAGVLANYAAG